MSDITTDKIKLDPSDKRYREAKYNAFKGTIAVCVFYAILATIILLVGYFTQYGREVMFASLRSFFATLVIGCILIIVVLTSLVIQWEPEEVNTYMKYDVLNEMSCPDYYETQQLNKQELDNVFNAFTNTTFNVMGDTKASYATEYKPGVESKDIFTSQCRPSKSIYSISAVADKPAEDLSGTAANWDTANAYNNLLPNSTLTADQKKRMLAAMVTMSGKETDGSVSLTASSGLKCDRVYPEYLSKLDADEYIRNEYKGSTNTYRCEYSRICNVPWTEAGCK